MSFREEAPGKGGKSLLAPGRPHFHAQVSHSGNEAFFVTPPAPFSYAVSALFASSLFS